MTSKVTLLTCLAVAGLAGIAGGFILDSWAGVGAAGSIASVIGLVVTAYVALTVRELRQRYVRHALLKASVGKLHAHRRNLSTAIRNQDAEDLKKQLSRIKAIFRRLAIHFSEQSGLQLNVDRLDAVLREGKRTVIIHAMDVLPQIDEKIEELSLLLVELEWSNSDV